MGSDFLVIYSDFIIIIIIYWWAFFLSSDCILELFIKRLPWKPEESDSIVFFILIFKTISQF